ncbi:cytidylyltransferase domain-containing protein [Kocuria massiliensis]|uniref:acylneuraminate cytidylyltransferase family protein n=1 Tax=Kocuria massiliensis TaxID=1926282 RepID=UPI000A1C8DFE|nr:acylneuraminate cytidylyltransferase family protein [Kocuria massiliensis]
MDSTKNILCVIPVRGGSKGIPRKNLLPIAGRPLVEWTVMQALQAQRDVHGEVDFRVVVSTDDQELAKVAREAGAEVPFMRPAELAEDTTATEPVIEHAMAEYRDRGFDPDAVVLLQATSPLRLPGTIARAVRDFLASEADSMVGVIPQGPFIWAAGETPRAEYDVMNRPRRQELTRETYRYRENGSLYVTSAGIYDRLHNRLGGMIELFIMDEIEGVDIDTPIDFAVAEAQLRETYPDHSSEGFNQ